MTATEKVAYLKGLIEGMEIDGGSKEGKLLKAVTDVLAELAVSVEELEEQVDELTDQVDAIDEDLDDLETDFYEDEDDDEEDGEDEFYDITCPGCGEEFCVDEDTLLEGGIECPNCGEHMEFDVECDENCDCEECGKDE